MLSPAKSGKQNICVEATTLYTSRGLTDVHRGRGVTHTCIFPVEGGPQNRDGVRAFFRHTCVDLHLFHSLCLYTPTDSRALIVICFILLVVQEHEHIDMLWLCLYMCRYSAHQCTCTQKSLCSLSHCVLVLNVVQLHTCACEGVGLHLINSFFTTQTFIWN